jgi:hypothetical protein
VVVSIGMAWEEALESNGRFHFQNLPTACQRLISVVRIQLRQLPKWNFPHATNPPSTDQKVAALK